MEDDTASKLRTEMVEKLHIYGPYAKAFQKVERHKFVGDRFDLEKVYSNEVLPIKDQNGNLITSSSEPLLMLNMVKLLSLDRGCRVLEIGTGTGYNAALLAELTGSGENVYTVEVNETVAQAAQKNLTENQYTNVHAITGDGSAGYAAGAPYDRIIVTAATTDFTRDWLEQLGENGILVAPFSILGPLIRREYLVRLKRRSGRIIGKFSEPWVSFTRMVGEHQESFEGKKIPKGLAELIQVLRKGPTGPWGETAGSVDVFLFCKICEAIQSNLSGDMKDPNSSWSREVIREWIREWRDDAAIPMINEYNIEVFTNEEPVPKSEYQFALERHCCKVVISY